MPLTKTKGFRKFRKILDFPLPTGNVDATTEVSSEPMPAERSERFNASNLQRYQIRLLDISKVHKRLWELLGIVHDAIARGVHPAIDEWEVL